MLPDMHGATAPSHKLLKLLQQQGASSLKELAVALGVTRTAVRQQITTLLAQGLVSAAMVRARRGRPHMVYRLSETGRAHVSRLSEGLALVLLEEMLLPPERIKARQLLQHVSIRLGARYAEHLQGSTPAERLQELGTWLDAQGIISQVAEQEDAFVFTVYGCPYYKLAQAHREVCTLETEAMALALGAPVVLLRSQLDGHQGCQFRMSKAPTGQQWRCGARRDALGADTPPHWAPALP
jgi:predicted ArsR family transcriptional regulator